jgi:hypothetical protein
MALRHGEAVDADTLLRQAGDQLRLARQAERSAMAEPVV